MNCALQSKIFCWICLNKLLPTVSFRCLEPVVSVDITVKFVIYKYCFCGHWTDRQSGKATQVHIPQHINILPSCQAKHRLRIYQVATKSDTAAEIGKEQGESRDKVFRYIRLTHLIPELLQKVDEGGIALSPAVELSYLSEEQQKILLDAMSLNDCTPSHAQSIRMKKAAQQGTLSSESIYEIMSEEKANQTERISFKVQDLKAFFPKNYTQKQMTDTILKLLYDYNRKLERSRRSRDER